MNKKCIKLLGMLCFVSLFTQAQDLAPKFAVSKSKFIDFRYGFLVGYATDWLAVSQATLSGTEPYLNPTDPFSSNAGNTGIDLQFWIGDKFGARLQPLLSFSTQKHTLITNQGMEISAIIDRVFVEVPVQALMRLKPTGATPYVFAGPRLRYDIHGNQSTVFFPLGRTNVAADLGVGYTFNLKKIRISPELTFSGGLKNQVLHEVIYPPQSETRAYLHRAMFSVVIN